MKPLSQLKYFFRLATERKLSGSDQLMYLHIFNKFNEARWTETLRINDTELKELMRLYDTTGKPASLEVVRRGRQRLKAKGFIEFTSGNGQTPEYRLLTLYPADTPADTRDDLGEKEGFPQTPFQEKENQTFKTINYKYAPASNNIDQSNEMDQLDEVVDFWEQVIRGARLTMEHLSWLDRWIKSHGELWVKEAMREAAAKSSNPHGVTFAFLQGAIERKAHPSPTKEIGRGRGDQNEKRIAERSEPKYEEPNYNSARYSELLGQGNSSNE